LTKYEQKIAALAKLTVKRREKTRLQYLANADVLEGWEWVAPKQIRSCLPCLMMDGMQFSLDTRFEDVKRCVSEYCRCTMIAVIKGVERPPRELGAEWFGRLSDDEKRMVAGGKE